MVDVGIVDLAFRHRIIGFDVWGCRDEAGMAFSNKFGKQEFVQRIFREAGPLILERLFVLL